MSGNRYVLDTNTVIAIIKGNEPLLQQTRNASFVGLSIISVIKYFPFSGKDKKLLFELTEESEVVNLHRENAELLSTIAEIRTIYRLKLPDAVIAATAVYKNASLISNDKHFQNINQLSVIRF